MVNNNLQYWKWRDPSIKQAPLSRVQMSILIPSSKTSKKAITISIIKMHNNWLNLAMSWCMDQISDQLCPNTQYPKNKVISKQFIKTHTIKGKRWIWLKKQSLISTKLEILQGITFKLKTRWLETFQQCLDKSRNKWGMKRREQIFREVGSHQKMSDWNTRLGELRKISGTQMYPKTISKQVWTWI